MQDINGRVYIVTGAASGIGAEVVAELVSAGGHVVALDRSAASLEKLEAQFASTGLVSTEVCDIAVDDQVKAAVTAAVERHGRLDGLVNAAGVVVTNRFLDFTDEEWDRVFRVNVLGTYLLLKHTAAHLKADSGGRVVNFSSMSAKGPNPFTAPYAASKAAVISLTRSAAVALAPEVTVNCVCPGIIDTPMWEQLERELADAGAPINFQSRSAQAPLARAGGPDDVAAAVLFLLSDASRFITGEDLNVNGGLAMH
jgi:NAD(P)-dependent dehydrogenase (short-subunit alcohol dehydrogenase family)